MLRYLNIWLLFFGFPKGSHNVSLLFSMIKKIILFCVLNIRVMIRIYSCTFVRRWRCPFQTLNDPIVRAKQIRGTIFSLGFFEMAFSTH